MNIIPILVFIGAAIVSTQAIDFMSGGASTAANLKNLAQNESTPPLDTPLPSPQPPPQFQPQPDFQQPPQQPQQFQQFPQQPTPFQQQPPFEPQQFQQPPQQLQPTPFDQNPQGQFNQQNFFPEENEPQFFVNPQEVKKVLREIRQIKTDLKRFTGQLKKIASGDDLAKINELAGQLDAISTILSNPSSDDQELQEAMQDFYNGEFWDEMNKLRAKIELPRELKQITSSIKRLEKLVALKTVQNIGIDLAKVRRTIDEMKQTLQTVQAHYQNGELQEAMEAMQMFHEDGHPGDIEGTIHKIREIKTMLKKVKDQAVRNQTNEILQEVLDAFNEGNWRDARETLDEYSGQLMTLLQKLMRSQTQRGRSTANQESFSKMQNLEGLIKNKLQEKGDTREQKQAGEQQFQFPNEMFKQFGQPLQGQQQGGQQGQQRPGSGPQRFPQQ